jgi:RNA polymerase sigma factor (sigma-70 family)
MFNDRRRFSMGETEGHGSGATFHAAGRRERIAVLYGRHARRVQWIVSGRVGAPKAVVEDACQIAWMRLWLHEEVSLEERAAVSWLVTTAVRVAWRNGQRAVLAGGWLPGTGHENALCEPCGDLPDPLDVVAERDEVRRALACLTVRERQFLALQAAGLSYREVAERLQVTVRTVERQILRGRHKLRRGGELS